VNIKQWVELVGPISLDDRGTVMRDAVAKFNPEVLPLESGGRLHLGTIQTEPNSPPTRIRLVEPDDAPRGIVLVPHQTTDPEDVGADEPFGLAGERRLAYGCSTQQADCFTLCLDYPGFGGYRPDVYGLGYSSVPAKMLYDYDSAIRYVCHRWKLRMPPIAAMGHSLGGTCALLLAAFRTDIKAVVCSAAATTFHEFAKLHGGLARWSRGDKYFPAIATEWRDDASRATCEWTDLLESIVPSFLYLSSPLADEIFPIAGARAFAEKAAQLYEAKGVPERLSVEYPDSGHAFPGDQQRHAWEVALKGLSS